VRSCIALLAMATMWVVGCTSPRVDHPQSAAPSNKPNPNPPGPDAAGPGTPCCASQECGTSKVPLCEGSWCGGCAFGGVCLSGFCFDDIFWTPVAAFEGQGLLGCNPDTGVDCAEDDQPQLSITTDLFEIAPLETTVREYFDCVDSGACSEPGFDEGCHTRESGDDLPVNCVSQEQAQQFCEHREMRLCTEAEWEIAARGNCEAWPELGCEEVPQAVWGNERPDCEQANLAGCSGAPVAVGTTYGGSAATASEMVGNVAEWTSSFYSVDTYETGEWPTEGDLAVVRGGSFNSEDFRATRRAFAEQGAQSPEIGIRCCRNP